MQESGVWLVAPEDKRYGQDVLIPRGATGTAKTGQVVVVELTEPPALFGQPVGRVKEVLGEIDDPGMEIDIAVRKYGVPHEFSEEAIALARSVPDAVRERTIGLQPYIGVPELDPRWHDPGEHVGAQSSAGAECCCAWSRAAEYWV